MTGVQTCALPILQIVLPASARDAKGLVTTAGMSDNPTKFDSIVNGPRPVTCANIPE